MNFLKALKGINKTPQLTWYLKVKDWMLSPKGQEHEEDICSCHNSLHFHTDKPLLMLLPPCTTPLWPIILQVLLITFSHFLAQMDFSPLQSHGTSWQCQLVICSLVMLFNLLSSILMQFIYGQYSFRLYVPPPHLDCKFPEKKNSFCFSLQLICSRPL